MRFERPTSDFVVPVVLAAVLAGAAWPLTAGDTPEESAAPAWTPELILQYRTIASTAISDDGSRVAYGVRHPEIEGEKSEFVERIRVAFTDGSGDYRYTRTDVSSSSPAFSPDGRYLAFLSKRSEEGKTQIWVQRVLGGEAGQLTDAESNVAALRWSPDGRFIAFLMPDPETEDEKTRKEEKRDVVLVNQDFKHNHLYVVDVRAEAAPQAGRRLTEGGFHVNDFDWSPDGETLVFSHQEDPRANTARLSGDLALVPAAGGEVTQLVTWGGVDRTPRFSPDGRWVAFVSGGEEPQPVGLGDVYVVSATPGAGAPRALAWTHDRSVTLVGWSGQEVLVSETRGTTRQIVALPLSGSAPRDVTALDGVISSVSSSRGGERLAFVHETPGEPPEVYTAAVRDFRPTRLSAVNRDVPHPPMGSTELLAWKSEDGLDVEGLLTYPVGYEKGRAYPLLLVIHGGPAGAHTQRFTGSPRIYPYQVFAQNGYALLSPNPRGSTGYGKDFRFANVRDWGHGDYEDLMSGVDRVIGLGVADPEQLYVMGWSYGGYMTSFLVTRTDRFRAASMGAGLPNLVSMVHTTDIPDYLTAHMGAELWNDYAVYEKHSAIYRVKNVKTPTQVIHGAEDLRVPFTQGQEFFVALERLGVPTEMVVYPRTPHGPREPKFLIDVSQRILTWFEKWRPQAP